VDRARDVVLLELTKSGRRREVPLNGPADAVLARLGGGEGLVLAGVRFHDLRHTFASWAMQRGATLPELQGPLGHSSTAMVLRYAHLAPEHLRSAVARLDDTLAPAAASTTEAQDFSDASAERRTTSSETAG
jgi:integrase